MSESQLCPLLAGETVNVVNLSGMQFPLMLNVCVRVRALVFTCICVSVCMHECE